MADEDGWGGNRRHDEAGLGRLLNIIKAQDRRIAAQERGAPLRAAGIGASPDGLTVNSSLNVDGSLSVAGDATIGGPTGLTWTDSDGNTRLRAGRTTARVTGAENVSLTYTDKYGANRVWLGEISDAVTGELAGHGLLVEDANGNDMFAVWDNRIHLRSAASAWLVADETVWITGEEDVRITAGEIFSLRTRGGSSNEWGVNVHSGAGGDMFHAIADQGFSLRTPNESHRIHVVGNDIGVDAPNRFYVAANVHATGNLSCGGTKPFIINHPTKTDRSLVHVATESDKAVVEYHYRTTIGSDGSATIDLPDYFEALTAPDSRGVQVTPVGRPFMVGAEEPANGQVVVYGDPGRDVFARVNARRGDTAGQFEVEIPRIQPPANTEEGALS